MGISLLIDFGSTYTKIRAIDLDRETLVGAAQSPSTVGSDITIGFKRAYDLLLKQMGVSELKTSHRLACSSAAGGLRMVVIGLVPELTAEAARRAALGSGAKVLGVFSYNLTKTDEAKLNDIAPDIILLAGGTDGGNRDVILGNARLLSQSKLEAPIVVAGNRVASDEVADILTKAGKSVHIAENVMPNFNELNVEPARSAIREVFMNRIVKAKGLDKVNSFIDGIVMPTPMATLNAAKLLADGTKTEQGLRELVVVEVGGATVNIHSIGSGCPAKPGLVPHGLPEPYAKRTVEGDLGIRYNARHILELAGRECLLENAPVECRDLNIEEAIEELSVNIGKIPNSSGEFAFDVALARTAVETAIDRHAGSIEMMYTPGGTISLLHGKDLTEIRTVIGTGGVFAYGSKPTRILEATLFKSSRPLSLRPKEPDFYIDGSYIMYAIGLLSSVEADKALRILKKSLVRLT